jgi:tyrosine-protein phosphatase SIW14
MRYGLLTPLFASLFAFVPLASAQPQAPGVGNFHELNESVYRGAQPSPQGFQSLAKLGVKTIIDLRGGSHRSDAEKKAVEAAGMHYVNIPLSGRDAPTEDQVQKLLGLLNDKTADPVFVHCRRGADRTGTIIACYRISHDHWENQKALAEAKANGMSWTEMAMKHYVLGYKTNDTVVASSAGAGSQPAAAAVAAVGAAQ